MESVMIILPFVGAGLFSAVFSRLTGMNLSTVSYTHLTLPTNREV